MDKARIYVDFNEMIDRDIVLLSKEDTKIDSWGNLVTFYEGMPVSIYSDDASDTGEVDNLIAEGIATKRDLCNYPYWQHVKWCCRIDLNSMKHESDLRKEENRMSLNKEFVQLLPQEIKKYRNDLLILRESLIRFKNKGMDKKSMLANLEELRSESDTETEDVLLELMDFVVGYCNPKLLIYE